MLVHKASGRLAYFFIGDEKQPTAALLISIRKLDGFGTFRLPGCASQLNLERIQDAFTILGVRIGLPLNEEPEVDAMEVETVREEPVMDVQSMEVDPSEELDSPSIDQLCLFVKANNRQPIGDVFAKLSLRQLEDFQDESGVCNCRKHTTLKRDSVDNAIMDLIENDDETPWRHNWSICHFKTTKKGIQPDRK